MEKNWSEVEETMMQLADKKTGAVQTKDIARAFERKKATFEEECDEAFKAFDYDEKGFITRPKLKVIAQTLCGTKLSDQEAEEMVSFFMKQPEGVSRADFIELQREFLKINKIL